jgi:hypothetical protein
MDWVNKIVDGRVVKGKILTKDNGPVRSVQYEDGSKEDIPVVVLSR